MQSNPPDLEKRTAEFFAAITRRDWDDVIERIHPEARAIQRIGSSKALFASGKRHHVK